MLDMTKLAFDVVDDKNSIREASKIVLDYIKSKCNLVDEQTLFDVKIIINEILTNSKRYGCSLRKDCKTGIKNMANIVVGISGNKELYLIVQDYGKGFNYSLVLNKCTDIELCIKDIKESGRGMLIVKNLSDRVTFNKKGNKIVVIKKLDKDIV
jgi:serine/threonine-protein kinase RsbW